MYVEILLISKNNGQYYLKKSNQPISAKPSCTHSWERLIQTPKNIFFPFNFYAFFYFM